MVLSKRSFSTMAPTTRRREGNGGQAAAGGESNNGDDAAAKRQRRRSRTATAAAATRTPTTPTTTSLLTAAEAADARELEELGGIDAATSFLYTPRTLTGLVIGERERGGGEGGLFFFLEVSCLVAKPQPPPECLFFPRQNQTGIALLIHYTGAFSNNSEEAADPAEGRRRGLLAALSTWLLYCLLQGSPRMPLLRPHPAVWRLVHGEFCCVSLFS